MRSRSSVLGSLSIVVALGASLGACGKTPTQPAGGAGGTGGNTPVVKPPGKPQTGPESTLEPQRKACAFKSGAWPEETIGSDFPIYDKIPIKHVMVIMQENRSFDHYLGRLVSQGYYQSGDFSAGGTGFQHHDQLDGPPANWSNPDGAGNTIVPHADNEHCFGVNHGWDDMHDDWDNGKNDHFVTNNNPDGQRTFFYEDDTVIPFYYGLADKFAIGDRYFASVMSSTWPNRFFLMAATSFGIGDNSFDMLDTPDAPSPQIFREIEAAGHTWKDYTDGPHMVEFFLGFGFQSSTFDKYGDVGCDLMNDIDKGTLPDVSFIMGDEVNESTDEGPSALPGIGGQLVETIVRKLWASPSWKDTALFITYDENGGMADHVPPEPACEPDVYAPHKGDGTPLAGKFDHTGFRVPFIVVSPYARRHFVSHEVFDHSSITRFIEATFGLPALTARDANATPPMELFDFESPPDLTAPTIDKTTTVPQEILTQCNQSMAPIGCH